MSYKYKNIYLINLFVPFAIFITLLLYYVYIAMASQSIPISNGCDKSYASFIQDPVMKSRKISFCSKQDDDKMTLQSNYFPITKYITFDYIGNPNGPNTSIYLEDREHHKYIIPNLRMRGDGWNQTTIKVPNYFKKDIHMVANDSSEATNGWIGLGNVIAKSSIAAVNISVYIKTMMYIFSFSFFISTIFGYYSNRKSSLEAFVSTSLLVGATSLVVFYTYLFSVELGRTLSLVIYGCALGSLIFIKKESFKKSVLLFSILVSMMTIIMFIAYDNVEIIENMQSISANRWHHLPVDNWIPKIFADAILRGHIPSPLFGDWLSSDRPPLQTGFFLIFAYIDPGHVSYLVNAVGMQLLVILFIFLFILKYVKDNIFVFFITILIFFNGFVFVHSLFVWPKLLSALFQGIAFYYLYKIWIKEDSSTKEYILFGFASSLAFLSHGGSAFYLLALSVLLLYTLKNKQDIKKLLYGLFVALITYLPWALYQKFVDPPGDRLLKWHLAGQIPVTNKPFLEVLLNYYTNLKFSDWYNTQIAHLERIYDSFYFSLPHIASLTRNQFLDNVFFDMNYSFLFFSIFLAPFYFFAKKQPYRIRALIALLLSSYILYTFIWSLLLVGGTVIHQGSFFAWFSGFIAISLITYSIHKYLFYILGFLNLLVFITIYLEPYLFHQDITSSSIVILAISTFVLTLYQLVQEDRGLE